MLLAPSIPSSFNLGVRPRAVTTPVRFHSPSGTWGGASTGKDLYPNLRSTPTQTTERVARKVQYYSTVRLCTSRTNSKVTETATPFLQSEIYRQLRQSASPTTRRLPIKGQAPTSSESPVPVTECNQGQGGVRPSPGLAMSSEVVDRSIGQPPPSPPSHATTITSQRFQAPARPESPLAHARRGAGHNVPPALVETLPTEYRLSIALPRPGGALLASEMITVSARRGGRLAVVADAWHLEHDCHYEWHVAFPQPEVDLGAVRARVGGDGVLIITVPRRGQWRQVLQSTCHGRT